MNHIDAARHHTCKRLWQRFGLAFSPADVKQLEGVIVDGHADWVADQPEKRRSVYHLRIARPDWKRDIYAVFDIRLWAVVTVLPCEQWVGRKKCRPKRRGSSRCRASR